MNFIFLKYNDLFFSWGVPYSRTPDLVRKEKEDETERVREAEEEEMVVEMEGGVSEGGDRQLDVSFTHTARTHAHTH